MSWLSKLNPFSGEKRKNHIKVDGDDLTVNVENKTFGRPAGDVTTHTINPETKESGVEGSTESPAPATPARPTDDPSPETELPEGTFGFPADRDFMQKIEARGVDGAGQPVETVYVLAGPAPGIAADLFRLDDPEYFASASRTHVRSYTKKMAEKVASLYPDGKAPSYLVRFHTHPSGNTRPSNQDRKSAEDVATTFRRAFDGEDFEFFQGIHAYAEHGKAPQPKERQQPTVRSNTVSWEGERFTHDLALFGPKFQNPRRVTIIE